MRKARKAPNARNARNARNALLGVLLGVMLAAALSTATASAAPKPPPSVVCGTACDGGGGGWSGCTQTSASDSAGWFLAGYHHVLVVSYCKRYGVITSLSIAAHYCNGEGFISCTAGPAWQTGGGVGSGYASFTGRATWTGTIAGAPYNSTSAVDLTIPWG